MAGLKLAKKALRKDMKEIILKLSDEEKRKQSMSVTRQLLNDDWYIKAISISIYLHMEDEIKTQDILKDAISCGKRCYIPRYFMGGNKMEMVLLKDMADYESLPVTKWNIKQPPDEEIREEALENQELDVMLIPGMAFTKNGKRLGRGKGYYDAYLSKAKNNLPQPPKTIALAFKQQIVDNVPTDELDFLIDKVMYDDQTTE